MLSTAALLVLSQSYTRVQGCMHKLPVGIPFLFVGAKNCVHQKESGSVNYGISIYGLFFEKNEVILYKLRWTALMYCGFYSCETF